MKQKFNHSSEVINAIKLIESNNFKIDFGFGGEIDNVIDNSTGEPITADDIWNYSKDIQDAILLLNELD